ncbi:MAG: PEP-utilizing enzyme [bacterium]|nr:PEP-utilizing enzyme [bacterium]
MRKKDAVKDLSIYEKLFSRDFCLPSVEAWVRGESINAKGWTKEKQPFLPYIITQRSDDTVHFYYNMQGVEWIQNLLVALAKRNRNFLKKIESAVLEKLKYIRQIYEKEKEIDSVSLKRFLKELEAGYPWFEAMWWFFQMDDSKLAGLDLRDLAKVRKLTDKLCNSSDTVIRKSLLKIYPELGDLSSVLQTREILNGNIPQKEELKERGKGYFFGNGKLITGLDKEKVGKIFTIHFKNEPTVKIRQLNGSTAYKGIVRGFVRRIMGHKQINEIKEGEILVSPMTIPDFIPAIKKAAAIVTDEGGVLSHAAIIARELKKPCIVGTKFATKIFKDGDLIEVDANRGIVTVLK